MVGEQITLLQHIDDRIRFLIRLDHADGLMKVQIEFFAHRVDFAELGFFKRRDELFKRQFSSGAQTVHARVFGSQSGFQAILDDNQLFGKSFNSKFKGFGNVFLCAAANVFCFCFGA